MADIFVYDAVRTPRGKGKKDGSLHEVPAVRLGARILEAVRDRNGLDTGKVDDIIFGCVDPVGEAGAVIPRAAAFEAGYDLKAPGMQISRFCASGLDAINLGAAKIGAGQDDIVVAGGVESMSRVGMGASGGSWFMDPSVGFPAYFVPQGVSADMIATKWGFSRDDVDAYSVESHKRSHRSWEEGRFNKSVVPVKNQLGLVQLARDETIRPNTDMQTLGGLNPSFQMMGDMAFDAVIQQRYPEVARVNHVHTPGNSSGIVDGSAGVLIGSLEAGKALGLKPRAKIRGAASIGSEPSIMLTGPEFVAHKLLGKLGMAKSDIDLWELNEAFAAVVLRFMQALDIPHDKINVCGGAIAMGHPLGATGAMITGVVLDELERSDKETALITLCIGGGMGTATVIERV